MTVTKYGLPLSAPLLIVPEITPVLALIDKPVGKPLKLVTDAVEHRLGRRPDGRQA